VCVYIKQPLVARENYGGNYDEPRVVHHCVMDCMVLICNQPVWTGEWNQSVSVYFAL